MATLPTLTMYDSNLIPNKATMTDEEFADAIHPYLNFWNERTIPELNAWRGALEQVRQEVHEKYIAVKNQAVDGGYSQDYLDTQYNPPMRRRYYVDAANGDDTNDGSSGSPFKTLKKAINSVPVGGYGDIQITGTYRQQDGEIWVYKKTIAINLRGELILDFVTRYSDIVGLSLNFSLIAASIYINIDDNYGGKFTINDNTLSGTLHPRLRSFATAKYLYVSSFTLNVRNRNDNTTLLYVGKDAWLLNCYDWSVDRNSAAYINIQGHYSGTNKEIVLHSNSKILVLGDGNGGAYINYAGGFKDENGNTITNFKNYISGVVKDTDGKPRNISSNIVL